MAMTTRTPVLYSNGVMQSIGAAARTAVFMLKLLPMLPSKQLDRVTTPTVVEHLCYPSRFGDVEGDLYRPATAGPHPGVVVCLGVVPFGEDHPQVPRLGEALARAGIAALLYWSPVMRDLRLDPGDIEDIALAYDALLAQPFIDPERSGLIGTCVGGSFALMAAASPRIRDRVGYVFAFAPYASMWTLGQDIASASRQVGDRREPWTVDQLTRKVYVRSLTAGLGEYEAELLRAAMAQPDGRVDIGELSADGRAIFPLLTALSVDEAAAVLHGLPGALQARLTELSPLAYLEAIKAPRIILCHDRADTVIPVSESRDLRVAFAGRSGVRYTEFTMFEHMDPTRRRLPLARMTWELGKFYRSLYAVFRSATGSRVRVPGRTPVHSLLTRRAAEMRARR